MSRFKGDTQKITHEVSVSGFTTHAARYFKKLYNATFSSDFVRSLQDFSGLLWLSMPDFTAACEILC